MSVIAGLAFVAFAAIVLGLIHTYIWWRAVRSTTEPGTRGRRIGTWLVVAALVITISAQAGSFLLPLDVVTPFAWIGFSWLGVAFYLFLLLLVGELVRLVAMIVGRRRPAAVTAPSSATNAEASAEATDDAPAGPPRSAVATVQPPTHTGDSRPVNRRLFLSRSIALGAGAVSLSVAGYGATRALGDPVVRRIPVQIAGLDPSLAGFRIAMFSDAHLGAIRRRTAMEKLVDTVNATEPDMVAVLGDLIDGSVAELGDDVAPLSRLESPHGSFFVTGNHEYYSGVQEWVAYLPDLGVRVLANERVSIERDGAAFDLAGVNDITGDDFAESVGGGGPDFAAALDGRSADRPVVLLAHQPVTFEQSVEFGVDLQLSGHTHGGQLWPFDYIISAQQGAVSGLSRIENTQLYVTSGAGFWGPPMRVGADPEVTVIELQPEGTDG